MGRIMSIDYGLKRTGIALTDPLQMIASPFTTVKTSLLKEFLEKQIPGQDVEAIVIGLPLSLNNKTNPVQTPIEKLVLWIKKKFPAVKLHHADERFTSRIAQRALLEAGYKKSDRQKKELVDRVSAALILQDWLASGNR